MRRVVAALLLCLSACASSPPPAASRPGEEVPANSDAENRALNAERRRRADESGALATTPGGAASVPASEPAAPTKPAGRGGPRATRAECEKVLDRYLELELRTNPELREVAQELQGANMLEALKAQARQQAGGKSPCETEGVSSAQFRCGMGAATPAAWKTCME